MARSDLNEQWSKLVADVDNNAQLKERLLAQPSSVLKEYGISPDPEMQEEQLSEADLARLSGGMKTDPNYVSSDVIDARGGYMQLMGYTFTFDSKGKISSVSK